LWKRASRRPRPRTPASDEDQASAGAQSPPTALLPSWKADVLCQPPGGIRVGLGKRSRLEPPEPPNRYERRHPGELLHVDVKKLGRIVGGAGKRFRDRQRQHYNRTFTD
jgi:hypothetical protein